jgi:murein DD-endopeptidase MepM/ murein hydrolase activator NlpD
MGWLVPPLAAVLVAVLSLALSLVWLGERVSSPPQESAAPAAVGPRVSNLERPGIDLESEADPLLSVLYLGRSDSALEDEAASRLSRQALSVRRGDTLLKLLVEAGIPRREAHRAITSLRTVYDPRDLDVGQTVTVLYRDESNGQPDKRFHGLRLDAAIDREVSVTRRAAGDYTAAELVRPLTRDLAYVAGGIETSLFLAAQTAGVPMPVVVSMIRLFSFDVDFQRDLQPGDAFEVLHERFRFADGRVARTGEVIHAALQLSGKRLPLYRFVLPDGRVDYFDEKGQGVRKALLRTPVDGARLSSRYGMRRHPIKGYTRMHRGIDFAAPTGTPIFAAGDGVVRVAGRNGGYGKYVRLRHNSTYNTAYAHLSRFAKGLRRGQRVRQGQVIGYVGSTGVSTGPHLHYEILRDGKQINPLKLKMPSGEKLTREALAAFQAKRDEIDRRVAALAGGGTRVASDQPSADGCEAATRAAC